jgi:hypothetical protein
LLPFLLQLFVDYAHGSRRGKRFGNLHHVQRHTTPEIVGHDPEM